MTRIFRMPPPPRLPGDELVIRNIRGITYIGTRDGADLNEAAAAAADYLGTLRAATGSLPAAFTAYRHRFADPALTRAKAEFMATLTGMGQGSKGLKGLTAPMMRGTNAPGMLTSRGKFWKSTVADVWNKAQGGRNGGKACGICKEFEATVAPGTGHRDWHIDHVTAHTNRWFRWDAPRSDINVLYQDGLQLSCPMCNIGKSNLW